MSSLNATIEPFARYIGIRWYALSVVVFDLVLNSSTSSILHLKKLRVDEMVAIATCVVAIHSTLFILHLNKLAG